MASRKQKAAARRNLKKARAAQRRRAGSRKRLTAKVHKRYGKKHKIKYVRVRGRRKHKQKHKRKHSRRKHKRTARHPRRRRGQSRRLKGLRRGSSHRVGRSRRTGRFSSSARHTAGFVAAESHRRRRRRRHRAGAMENPLGGMEIFVGLITGVIGYSAANMLDRFVVSRERKDDKGVVMGPRWNTAPLTDDLLVRGGVGVAIAAVPLIGAHFVRTPWIRSALQLFGFGAAFHLAGKAVDDLAAYALKDTKAGDKGEPSLGKRLYGTELVSRNALGLAGLPGLGACPTCQRSDGLGGMCCNSMYAKHGLPAPGRGQPPVVVRPPQQFAPPPEVIRQVPLTPLTPETPLTPLTPAIPGQPPLTAASNPFGVNGLGDATNALRAYPDAYRALRSNAPALAAVRNGHATMQQRAVVEQVTAQHGHAIQTFTAIEQRSPGVIQQAARGLAGLIEPETPRKFRGASKWSRDDAAE